MNAKAFLQQIEKLDTLIANTEVDVQFWRDLATNTAVNMSGERVQSSGNHDTTEKAICTYLDLEAENEKRIKELAAIRRDIISVIEQLKPVEYDLLHLVYVQRKTLMDVAIKHDRSYSWATTTHSIALKHVQKILDERGTNAPTNTEN